ncbi:hypothetical protein, partial [Pantoea sp. UBA4549]|uniref:hypothetical protein n=1 Tax=Pantoea sp. UBA4549 TaxID=1947033 RepID=UPI0025CDA273
GQRQLPPLTANGTGACPGAQAATAADGELTASPASPAQAAMLEDGKTWLNRLRRLSLRHAIIRENAF